MYQTDPGKMCLGPFRKLNWYSQTTLGVGNASFLSAEVDSAAGGAVLIKELHKQEKLVKVLGAGSNFVGSDLPMDDTVFLTLARNGESGNVTPCGETMIEAGAALPLREIIHTALERYSLGGFSSLSGIPGTLGGVLAMNAGANGHSISDFVQKVWALSLEDGELREFDVSELNFSYRSSPVLRGKYLILKALLCFEKTDVSSEILKLREESERRSKSPKGPSAGSIFRNPPDVSAGKLLEDAGCKGLEQGAFKVSEVHANWIVRKSGFAFGSTADLLALMREMRRRVREKFRIELTPEVRFANMTEGRELDRGALKVLVVKGGCSSEREVSLQSGAAIAGALRESGFHVQEYDVKSLALTKEMYEADIVWPVLHGGFGEDGRFQKLLEDASIAFVGSGSNACDIMMDKVKTKVLMTEHGIPNAKYAVVTPENREIPKDLKFPLVVKPVSEGSTFGLSVVEKPEEWEKAMKLVFQYGDRALIEEFFTGIETTLGIAVGRPLPLIEIRYSAKVYDYDAKYLHKTCETQYLCPAPSVPQDMLEKIQEAALKFYHLVGARDVIRVDVMVNLENRTFCLLEGNAIPGCTANSLVPKAAKAAGIPFAEFCTLLLTEALKRKV